MRPIFLALTLLLAACGERVEQDNVEFEPDSLPPEAGNAMENATAPDPQPAIAGAIPEAFRGTYDQDEQSCGRPSQYRLVIDAAELRYHESSGKVRSVKVLAPERIEIFADYQGEGETWQNVRTLALDGKRLTISGEGTTADRVRCPEEAQAGIAG